MAKDRRGSSSDRSLDRDLHLDLVLPADVNRLSHPPDGQPGVGVAQPRGTIVTAALPPLAEEEALRGVGAYFSMRLPGQIPIITFVWRCDHGSRLRCSTTAVWHVRVNDQVCTVHEDRRVEPTFASLLSPTGTSRPSCEDLATLNAELRSKSPEAIARLLDIMEGYAKWDAPSQRFVCTDSGWATTVQALDYYVDDPELWRKRAEAAARAAIDDEMEEWERTLQDTVLERVTALFRAATSGARFRAAGDAAGAGPSPVSETLDDVARHSPAS